MINEMFSHLIPDKGLVRKRIFKEVIAELKRAEKKWPVYYRDIIHAVSLVSEESGEASRAALNHVYDNGSIDEVKKELIQAAAMCFRALENLDDLAAIQQLMK